MIIMTVPVSSWALSINAVSSYNDLKEKEKNLEEQKQKLADMNRELRMLENLWDRDWPDFWLAF